VYWGGIQLKEINPKQEEEQEGENENASPALAAAAETSSENQGRGESTDAEATSLNGKLVMSSTIPGLVEKTGPLVADDIPNADKIGGRPNEVINSTTPKLFSASCQGSKKNIWNTMGIVVVFFFTGTYCLSSLGHCLFHGFGCFRGIVLFSFQYFSVCAICVQNFMKLIPDFSALVVLVW
jgi:hypothetical protein